MDMVKQAVLITIFFDPHMSRIKKNVLTNVQNFSTYTRVNTVIAKFSLSSSYIVSIYLSSKIFNMIAVLTLCKETTFLDIHVHIQPMKDIKSF